MMIVGLIKSYTERRSPGGSLLSINALIKTPICWMSKLTIDLIVYQFMIYFTTLFETCKILFFGPHVVPRVEQFCRNVNLTYF